MSTAAARIPRRIPPTRSTSIVRSSAYPFANAPSSTCTTRKAQSGPLRLRLIYIGLTQHLSIDLLADTAQKLSHANIPPRGFSSHPSQEAPHDDQAHSVTADSQRRSTRAVRERECSDWFARAPLLQVGVIGNRRADMRRASQIVLQRSKRAPALRAEPGKLRLDVGTHDGNYLIFGQTPSSLSWKSNPARAVGLVGAARAATHDITRRGTNLWANGPASQ
jgi:hypothetical protein